MADTQNKDDGEAPIFLSAGRDVGSLVYEDEPPGIMMPNDFDKLLVWASKKGASEVRAQTNEKVCITVAGKIHKVTKRKLSNPEVSEIMSATFKSESIKAKLSGPEDEDYAYDIRPTRDERFRFRVNVTAIVTLGNMGVQIVMRAISSIPPKLESLGIEPEITNNIPDVGMMLITGATGSGKSTLLASFIRSIMEEGDAHKAIVTYEAPIEYVYDEVESPTCIVAQTEVPRNLPTFSRSARNSLRRQPNIILVGELRDAETIGEGITASETGHALFSTVHSDGFAQTFKRMINVFPEGERNSRATDIIMSLKLCVSQVLVPRVGGGRVALREFVVMTPEITEKLLSCNLDKLTLTALEVLDEYGQSFLQAAKREYQKGNISEDVYERFIPKKKAVLGDALEQVTEGHHQSGAEVRPPEHNSTKTQKNKGDDNGGGLSDFTNGKYLSNK